MTYEIKFLKNIERCFLKSKFDAMTSKCILSINTVFDLEKSNQFKILYQPIVNLMTNEIVCFEALLRYIDRNGTLNSPSFIDSFTTLDLMHQLDLWVLAHAIREFIHFDLLSSFHLSVNMSPQTLKKASIVDDIVGIIRENGVNFDSIEIEVTEDVHIPNDCSTWHNLSILQSYGIRIVLDDFGTEHSSINYLGSLEFDKVKLDRSLINLNQKYDNFLINCVKLVKVFNSSIVIEGIENVDQLNAMKCAGVDFGQGYYLGKPMMSEDIWKYVNRADSK